jgi:hypothetical protein
MNNQTTSNIHHTPLILTWHGVILPPIEGFDPNNLESFNQAVAHISSFLRFIRDPLAEYHRGNATFYDLMIQNAPNIERDLLLYARVMSAEARIYQTAQLETRSRNADQIVLTRRKRTHQEMENKYDERDEKLAEEEKKLEDAKAKKPRVKPSCSASTPSSSNNHRPHSPPPPAHNTVACAGTPMEVV